MKNKTDNVRSTKTNANTEIAATVLDIRILLILLKIMKKCRGGKNARLQNLTTIYGEKALCHSRKRIPRFQTHAKNKNYED